MSLIISDTSDLFPQMSADDLEQGHTTSQFVQLHQGLLRTMTNQQIDILKTIFLVATKFIFVSFS